MAIEKQKPANKVVSWQPFTEIEDMRNSFEDVFGLSFLPDAWRQAPAEETIWAPTIDVVEKPDKFLVKVELPGVNEEDINVYVTGNTLTIKVKRKQDLKSPIMVTNIARPNMVVSRDR